MKPATEIRQFRTGDIQDILDIEKEAFPKTAYSREILIEYARVLPESFVILVVDDSIIGYVIYDRKGHIHSTAVKRYQRRKGYGRMLFSHAMKQVRKKLWLEVRLKNTIAREFYEKMGMKIVGRKPNYYGDDDALVMELERFNT